MSQTKAPATLVIMAAGMGSRFGGLKQVEPLGPDGQAIIDYSVYDAVEAGFHSVVVIIKKAIEQDFRSIVGKRIEKQCDVHYVFQETDSCLPAGFALPAERKKPWGTGHAVLCARDAVKTPFAVINADDFYGKASFAALYDHLSSGKEMCMVGFDLGNTLTENGTVSRGVCETEGGYLRSVTEHTALDRSCGLPMSTTVSMNMWGLHPDFFDVLERGFSEFLQNLRNPEKDEFYLPFAIDRLIREEGVRCRVLHSPDRWYGVTYQNDAATVRNAIREMTEKGMYRGI